MKKIILLISIFFISLAGIHSNEVQVMDNSQNIYNVNLSFSQNEELFSKDKIIDFKKKQSTNNMPDDVKTEYYKYKGMQVFGIILLSIGAGCMLIDAIPLLIISLATITLHPFTLFSLPFLIIFAASFFVLIPIGLMLIIYGAIKAKSIKILRLSYNSDESQLLDKNYFQENKNKNLEMCFTVNL